MKKKFWDNPYQTTLTTNVASVDKDQLLFDETIIYSFVGAQESDKATINNLPVLDSKIIDQKIYYTLPEEHGLKVGDSVTMQIDWPRRYRLMRLHFAAELILELVTKQLGLKKIGAHIAEHKARIDFVSETSLSPHLPALLAEYNKIIEADLPIQKDFSDKENQRRFWKIDGFAQVPCGGTHVKSTAEVGFVTLKRDNRGKNVERIEIKLVDPDQNL